MSEYRGRAARWAAAALAVALALGLSACGSDDSSDSSEPMPAPPVRENVDQAVKRMQKVVDGGDCEQINELNPLGRPAAATKQRCLALKRILGLDVTRAEQYGKLGGVVAFQRGIRILNAILLRDSDGLLHVGSIEALTGKAGTEGNLAPEFKKVADQGLAALADRDCEAFLPYAFRRFGFGAGNNEDVCIRVQNNIVASLLESGGEPTPVGLAGNSTYAFFGVATPSSFITLLAARESEDDLPEGVPESVAQLPEDAPEYGIADAVRTNPREPIEAPDATTQESSPQDSSG
jgi:hypothetical protein